MTTLADTWGIHESQFWLRGVRPDQPVQHDPATGMWNVYGYPEIVQILSDPGTFSSNTQRLVPEAAEFSEGNLVQLDPPEHHSSASWSATPSHRRSSRTWSRASPR
jgi:cytochrome P450